MNDRKKIIRQLQNKHENYISWQLTENDKSNTNFNKLRKEFNDLLRKEISSENSVKQIIKLTKTINRIYWYNKSKGLVKYDFLQEIEIINMFAKGYLSQRYKSNYDGKFKFKGENLLNLYLELVIKFTILRTENNRNIRPDFLKNPLTGQSLELDIFYKDFKLAFEFQGEHHYSNLYQVEKDKEKLNLSCNNGILLIPINACQLNSTEIISLTINNIKDFYNLNDSITQKSKQTNQTNQTNIRDFQKLAQRMQLSLMIFHDSFSWLDNLSNNYINKAKRNTPNNHTINYPAPSLLKTEILDIDTIYKNIKYLN